MKLAITVGLVASLTRTFDLEKVPSTEQSDSLQALTLPLTGSPVKSDSLKKTAKEKSTRPKPLKLAQRRISRTSSRKSLAQSQRDTQFRSSRPNYWRKNARQSALGSSSQRYGGDSIGRPEPQNALWPLWGMGGQSQWESSSPQWAPQSRFFTPTQQKQKEHSRHHQRSRSQNWVHSSQYQVPEPVAPERREIEPVQHQLVYPRVPSQPSRTAVVPKNLPSTSTQSQQTTSLISPTSPAKPTKLVPSTASSSQIGDEGSYSNSGETRYAKCCLSNPFITGCFQLKETQGQDKLTMKATILGQRNPVSGYTLSKGFHNLFVTEYGPVSDTCRNMGSTYNPTGVAAGPFWSDQRRVGDLAHLEVSEQSSALYVHIDDKASLFGAQSIVGRGIVITANEHDLQNLPAGVATVNDNFHSTIVACCPIILTPAPGDQVQDD